MEDKEWVLKNVEEICANTRDIDEVCMALEHSTIFARAMIENLTKTILDLQQELSKANDKLNEIEELISTYPSVRIIEEQGIRFAIEVSSSELVDLLKTVLKIIKRDEEE